MIIITEGDRNYLKFPPQPPRAELSLYQIGPVAISCRTEGLCCSPVPYVLYCTYILLRTVQSSTYTGTGQAWRLTCTGQVHCTESGRGRRRATEGRRYTFITGPIPMTVIQLI